jgi:hypothetical protein
MRMYGVFNSLTSEVFEMWGVPRDLGLQDEFSLLNFEQSNYL